MGTLDDDAGIKPSVHIFVADKVSWFEISDRLRQYSGMPDS
jgi:hypothetical protein